MPLSIYLNSLNLSKFWFIGLLEQLPDEFPQPGEAAGAELVDDLLLALLVAGQILLHAVELVLAARLQVQVVWSGIHYLYHRLYQPSLAILLSKLNIMSPNIELKISLPIFGCLLEKLDNWVNCKLRWRHHATRNHKRHWWEPGAWIQQFLVEALVYSFNENSIMYLLYWEVRLPGHRQSVGYLVP